MGETPMQMNEHSEEATLPTVYISGPYLQQYPDIVTELKRLHIWGNVRLVELTAKEVVFKDSSKREVAKMLHSPLATAILHTGEQIQLTLNRLAYNPVPTPHDGYLGGAKSVKYKKKVWNEVIETYMPGIRLSSRTLTVHQALELLEWLEQERATLEQKVQEEQSAPMQG